MTNDPLAHLTPADAVASLRSLPRRFGEAFAPAPDAAGTPDELAQRVGADGRSPAQHLTDVVNGLPLLNRALEQVLTSDDPALHPGITDLGGQWDDTPVAALESALAQLGDAAIALADRAARVGAKEWNRTGHLADGAAVSALELLRAAVRLATDALRACQADPA